MSHGVPSAKANGVAAVILLGIVAVACVRRVEFTGDLRPVFIYRWQPRPEDRFEEYRSQAVSGAPLPPIDLTIRSERDYPRYRGPNLDGVAAPGRPPLLLFRIPPRTPLKKLTSGNLRIG